MEDLSRRGAMLSLSLPLPVGGQVNLRTTGFSVSAGVRYCELADAGYAVGLEFSAGTVWDEKSWSPEHLLRIPSREHQE